MSGESKVLGLMGIAAKGRLIVSGEFSVEKTVRSGRAHLVVLASDASENTKKKFHDMCDYYKVPFFLFSEKEVLGHSIGRDMRVSCAITDDKLAAAIRRILEQDPDVSGKVQ